MDNAQFLIVGLAVALICGAIGTAVGHRKGRGAAGFIWGAVLGPIGWLLIFVGPSYAKPRHRRRANW